MQSFIWRLLHPRVLLLGRCDHRSKGWPCGQPEKQANFASR